MSKVYCKGIECPVRNTCLRYTLGIGATLFEGCSDVFMRKCTLQRKYVQDTSKINKDSLQR